MEGADRGVAGLARYSCRNCKIPTDNDVEGATSDHQTIEYDIYVSKPPLLALSSSFDAKPPPFLPSPLIRRHGNLITSCFEKVVKQ
jgi:hypothetical protein